MGLNLHGVFVASTGNWDDVAEIAGSARASTPKIIIPAIAERSLLAMMLQDKFTYNGLN